MMDKADRDFTAQMAEIGKTHPVIHSTSEVLGTESTQKTALTSHMPNKAWMQLFFVLRGLVKCYKTVSLLSWVLLFTA